MKIYPCLSYRREINETNVNYTLQLAEDMGQLWLAEWKWLLTINLYLIYNSSDQRKFFNTMECDHREKSEKGKRKKDNFEVFHIFG